MADFEKVLDDCKIESNQTQREQLFRLIDNDKDRNVSKEELEQYLSNYNEANSLSTNILLAAKNKNKLDIFQDVFDVKLTLTPDDYFLHDEFTTIMNSDYAALTRCEQLLAEIEPGKRFFDKEFGPSKPGDEKGSRMALYATGEAPKGYVKPEQIDWYYPKEIVGSDNYMFTNEEASSNEVIQGALGDCWFIGALSVLASRDELLIGGLDQYRSLKGVDITKSIAKSMTQGVFPPIFQAYARKGMYVFKFFKNFCWRYVIIDERLPCYKSNKTPVFGRCSSKNELWVPLIEKAYAKLHRCYESLVSGFIDDGLTDLTGFVAEKINLHDKNGSFPNNKIGTKDQFWEYLTARRNEESMLGCARKDETVEGEVIIDGERTGILSRHAYGLLDVFEIKGIQSQELFRLLRVRNPWGKTEWVGDWSDTSDEIDTYKNELQKYIDSLEDDEKFELGAEDGTFLISYDDWSDVYNKLYVTIDFPPSWSGIRFTDSWDDSCAGGLPMPVNEKTAKSWAKNPQYLIKFDHVNEVEFFFSLAQDDGRINRNSTFPFIDVIHPVNLIIYPTTDGKPIEKFDSKKVKPEWISAVVEHKEVSLRAKLEKGMYIVVPSTRSPDQLGDYYLSVYYNTDLLKVQIKHLKKPDTVKGLEIIEEDEDDNITDTKLKIIQARLEDLQKLK